MFFQSKSKYNWREVFLKYGKRLASLTHHHQVYQTLLSTLMELSGAENASVLLFDPALCQFVVKESLGAPPLSFAIPEHHVLVLWLKRDGAPLTKHALAREVRFLDIRKNSLTYFSEFNTDIAFPLIVERKFFGILNLGSREHAKPYDSEDLEIFNVLVNLGAVFIENSQFYETLLRQNASLSEVAELKTQFVSNVTHELRTPLHGILGLAELLLEDSEQCLSADYRRYLEMLRHSASALLELVDHILDLTKYQSGLVELKVKRLDLRKLIEEAALNLQEEFTKQGCAFHLEWPESSPGIYGDEEELKTVLHSLLSNALKFAPQGQVRVSSSKTGEMLKVCVQDTGIGIEEKDQRHIFEDFRQAQGELSRSFGGTGLGLTLAKKIVELHGGRIWVESKRHHGSQFYFTLPLKPIEA